MKFILKLEELCMLAMSLYGLWWLEAEWWWYPVLLFGPDISMLGYLINSKAGAVCYNLFHHKGIAIGLLLAGIIFYNPHPSAAFTWYFLMAGVILFGHSSMDRVLGYGLKYSEGFKFTHLGVIGKNKIENS